MTANTLLLPGVDLWGAGYRVRISVAGHRFSETGFATADAANARVLEMRKMRGAGLTPAATVVSDPLLREAAEALLVRKRSTVSRKTKQRLRPRGIEWWERATRPWREGEFAELPLSVLRRAHVEDVILTRAMEVPKTARDELHGLKATLRYAGGRGASFDQALLGIEPLPVTIRRRKAVSVDQLELLAELAPEYAQRMLLLMGTAGNRIGELFTLTDDRVDLKERTLFIPAELCKEGSDKWIDLTLEEVALVREQLLVQAPSTPLVFPTKTGRPWRHYQFLRLVWYKATERAAVAWREKNKLAEDAPTPFDELNPHDLRATAATLMRDAGFTREQAASRLGHADSGKLLDRIYDVGDRQARVRKAIAEHAPQGLRAESKKQAPPSSAKPTATPAAGETVAG